MRYQDLLSFQHPEYFQGHSSHSPAYSLVICHALHKYYRSHTEDETKIAFDELHTAFKSMISSENPKPFEKQDFMALYPFLYHSNRTDHGILVLDKTNGVPAQVLYPPPIERGYEQGKQHAKSRKKVKPEDRQKPFMYSLLDIDKKLSELFNLFKDKDWGKIYNKASIMVDATAKLH